MTSVVALPTPVSAEISAAASSGGYFIGVGDTPAGWSSDDHKLTPEKEKSFSEFKKRCVSVFALVNQDDTYWKSDHACLRVLRARRFNVDNAVKMYEGIVKFRNENQCWRFLDPTFYKEPEVLRRYFCWGFVGQDRDGYPVLIERIGKNDLLGVYEAAGEEAFLKWVIYYHELQEKMMREASKAVGADRHQLTVIVDLDGYSMRLASPATLGVLHKRTRLEEDNYPELLKRLFLINSPSLFATVWSVVAYFMDEGTRSKVQLLSSEYLSAIVKFVDKAYLPGFLGGDLKDKNGDSECRSMVSAGGLIPFNFLCGVASDGNGAGDIFLVSAGSISTLYLKVPSNWIIDWRWAVENNDVEFSVTAIDLGKNAPTDINLEAIIDVVEKSSTGIYSVERFAPANTVTTSFPTSEDIIIKAVSPSRISKSFDTWTVPSNDSKSSYLVKLTWSNSFSWMTGKNISRRIDTYPNIEGAKDKALKAIDQDGKHADERAEHMASISKWIRS
jgi:hypothetical protein